MLSLGLMVCVWFCCVRFTFFGTSASDRLWRMSLKRPSCVDWDTKPNLSQSVSMCEMWEGASGTVQWPRWCRNGRDGLTVAEMV